MAALHHLLKCILWITILEIISSKFMQLIVSRNIISQFYITVRGITHTNVMCIIVGHLWVFVDNLEMSKNDEKVKQKLELMVVLPIWLIFQYLGLLNEWLKWDEPLIRYFLLWIENYFYNNYYQRYNRSMPSHLYEMNERFENNVDCAICWDIFDEYGDEKEIILKCGHRFHGSCLREWELEQFDINIYESYKCPICRSNYNFRYKWNYIYQG